MAGYPAEMRIVIVGATGNVGTALLRRLGQESDLDIAGIVRRVPVHPEPPYDAVEWHSCDIGAADAPERLTRAFSGADAVVHLGWQIQPSHDQKVLYRTNVIGSAAVIEAVVGAGVPALIYASSVGTYAAGPKDRLVDEDWPATGVPGSSYSRDKAAVEAMLDQLQAEQPALRLVRLRPGLIFQRDVGTEIGRYFLGPFVPTWLLRFNRLPLVPSHGNLRMQAVHADDVADAYARALLGDARGAFNIAADPVLSPALVAEEFHGRTVGVPSIVLRAAAALSWQLRLQPVDRGWVDLALAAPLMSTARAESELGWRPSVDAVTALRELFAGLAEQAHTSSPPLSGRPELPGRLGGVLRGRWPGAGNPY
jgi:nucleoside-diphosphate-sugar epimerase